MINTNYTAGIRSDVYGANLARDHARGKDPILHRHHFGHAKDL